MFFSNNDYFALVHDDPMQGIRPSLARMKKFGNHMNTGRESKEDGAGDTTPTTKLVKAPPFPLKSKVWLMSSTGRFDWFIPAVVESYLTSTSGKQVTAYVLSLDDKDYNDEDFKTFTGWMKEDAIQGKKELENASPKNVVPRWDGVIPPCPVKGFDVAQEEQAASAKRNKSDRLAQAKEQYGKNLGYTGATQDGLGPEMWGITLQQLKDVISDPDFDQSIKAKYMGTRVSGGMTMRQVVHKILEKRTAGKGVGYALLVNKAKPLRAKVMVSHSWEEDYEHFVSALDESGEEGPFWICATAIYQCNDIEDVTVDKQLGPHPSTGPFATVLKQADKMVCVMTPESDIYTRLWCVYEMYVAVSFGVSVGMAYFSESKGWGGSGQIYSNSAMETANGIIKTIDAECSWETDTETIQGEVKKLPRGFDLLNDVIYWIKVTSLVDNLLVGDMENIIDTPFGISSASCAGARVNVAIAKVLQTWSNASSLRSIFKSPE